METLVQLAPERAEAEAFALDELDEAAVAQLAKPFVQHGRADPATGLLEAAKAPPSVSQLPQHAHCPAAAEQLQQLHDRPRAARRTGGGPGDGLAGTWSGSCGSRHCGNSSGLALRK